MTAQLIVVSIWAAGKGTMAASVLAFHLDNGSQQAGFHCLLSQARVEFVPELLQGADIAHRNARLRENERTMFEV